MSIQATVFVFLMQCADVRLQSGKGPVLPNPLQRVLGLDQRRTTPKIYNPHYGYEPYWVNGDWVIKEEELPPGITTTSVPLVCGEECLEIYTPLGAVCGHQTSYIAVEGCEPTVLSWFCSGIQLDDQSKGYETFPTYCKFLDRQCRSKFDEKWIFVHPGPCVVPQSEVFRPFSISDLPISRMTFYLNSLASLFNNQSIDHTIFGKDY